MLLQRITWLRFEWFRYGWRVLGRVLPARSPAGSSLFGAGCRVAVSRVRPGRELGVFR